MIIDSLNLPSDNVNGCNYDKKNVVNTIFSSAMLFTWSIFFPDVFIYFNSNATGETGPQKYYPFLPVVYVLSFLSFCLGCYFIFTLIKDYLNMKSQKQ